MPQPKNSLPAMDNQPPLRVVIYGLIIVVCLLVLFIYTLTRLFPSFFFPIKYSETTKKAMVVETDSGGEDARALIEISDFDWDSGDQEKAINMLREIIAETKITNVDGLAAWARLGMRFNSIGKYDKTIDLYESLFEYIDPQYFKSADAFVMLAHAYEAQYRYIEMLWALRMGLKVAETNRKAILMELAKGTKKAYFGIHSYKEVDAHSADKTEYVAAWHREKKIRYQIDPMPLISGDYLQRVEPVEQRINPIRFYFNEEGTKKLEEITAKMVGKRVAILINGSVLMTMKINTAYLDGVLTLPGPFRDEDVSSIEEVFNQNKVVTADESTFDVSFKFKPGDRLKYRSDANLRLPNPLIAQYQQMKRTTWGELECTEVSDDGIAKITYVNEGEELNAIAESLTGSRVAGGGFSYRITPRGRRLSDEFKDYLIISDIPYLPEYPWKLDVYWQDKTIKWSTSPDKQDLFTGSASYIPIARQRIWGMDSLNIKLFLKMETPPKEVKGNAHTGFGFKKGPVASSPPQPITEAEIEKYKLSVHEGALVREVIFGTPAMAAGLQEGDVINQYDGKPVKDWRELEKIVRTNEVVGRKVPFTVVRGNEKKELTLVTGKLINSYKENKQLMTGFGRILFTLDEGIMFYSLLEVKRISGTTLHDYRLSTELIDL